MRKGFVSRGAENKGVAEESEGGSTLGLTLLGVGVVVYWNYEKWEVGELDRRK